MQRIGKMKTLIVQTNHPVSHRLNYLQANRKAIGRFLMSLTKKGMLKKCCVHNNLFRELQGKKDILASIMHLTPLAPIITGGWEGAGRGGGGST